MPTATALLPLRIRFGELAPYILMGAASASIALLPWLLTGLRLPLQNLWATTTLPDDMPLALLPFNQYALALLGAMMVTGAALAGLCARATRAQHPRFGVPAVAGGVAAVQAAATVQTAIVVSVGLADSPSAELYFIAILAAIAAAILLGQLVLLLIARATAPGVVIGLSIAGVLTTSWLDGFGGPFGVLPLGLVGPLHDVSRWVPAVVIALALVWAGLGSLSRTASATAGLLILWIAPAVISAATVTVGTRAYLGRPAEMPGVAQRTLLLELGPDGGSLLLVPATIVLTALGLTAKRLAAKKKV